MTTVNTLDPMTAPRPIGDVVIEIRSLSVQYGTGPEAVHAVRSVDLTIRKGEVIGLAGESGSGKSTLAFALTRLLRPPGQIVSGSVLYHENCGATDLVQLSAKELKRYRWEHIAVVFQSAMNALNPVLTIGKQLDDVLKAHRPGMRRPERKVRGIEMLSKVGITADRLSSFPHQLSGGMRQRAMIAMALMLDPDVIVMDEPTTALDVVTQRAILEEVARLQHEHGFTVIFITHDVSLLLEIADRIAIMYAGRIVEVGRGDILLAGATHPYTQGLLGSFPSIAGERRELEGIPGKPPDLRALPAGCAFAPRCPHVMPQCRELEPMLSDVPGGSGAAGGPPPEIGRHLSACWRDGSDRSKPVDVTDERVRP